MLNPVKHHTLIKENQVPKDFNLEEGRREEEVVLPPLHPWKMKLKKLIWKEIKTWTQRKKVAATVRKKNKKSKESQKNVFHDSEETIPISSDDSDDSAYFPLNHFKNPDRGKLFPDSNGFS